MRQSTVIFASIIFAFIVYITMRGQLPAYIDLFKPTKSAPASGGTSSSSGGGAVGNAIKGAADAVKSGVVDKAKSLLGGIF